MLVYFFQSPMISTSPWKHVDVLVHLPPALDRAGGLVDDGAPALLACHVSLYGSAGVSRLRVGCHGSKTLAHAHRAAGRNLVIELWCGLWNARTEGAAAIPRRPARPWWKGRVDLADIDI